MATNRFVKFHNCYNPAEKVISLRWFVHIYDQDIVDLLAFMQEKKIRGLNLKYNDYHLSNDGLLRLIESSQLQMLDLTCVSFDYKVIKAIAAHPTLREFTCDAKIHHNMLGALSESKTLTHLDIRNVNDEVVDILAKNTSLTHLKLTNGYITSEGAKKLAQHTSLTSLTLKNQKINNECTLAFAKNERLKHLSLKGNFISNEGAKAFLENKNLTYLDLSHNIITSQHLLNEINKNIEKNRRYALKDFATTVRMLSQLRRNKKLPIEIATEIAKYATSSHPFSDTKEHSTMIAKFFGPASENSTIISDDIEKGVQKDVALSHRS